MLKKIDGWEEYFIDEEGNVYRKLKPYTGRQYPQIALSKNGKYESKLVHHLMAEVFLGGREGKSVHHINGNKKDNRINNLKLINESEHRKEHSKTENRVFNFVECELYYNDELISNFKSIAEACRFASENYGISYFQLNKKKEYKGYRIVKKSVTTRE